MSLLRNADIHSVDITRNNNRIPIIQANDISVKYDVGRKREDIQSLAYNLLSRSKRTAKEFWALKDVSFTGYSGDIIGIIGANGAGKSTLCKVISGLIHSDKGTIKIDGRVSSLLSLGAGFNKEISGIENILLNGMMLGLSKSEVKDLLQYIIEFSGLEYFIDQPLKYYSSGMKARLGFSIAAAVEPEILVLDEALNAGDLQFNKRAALKMQEIVNKAKMAIVVTHQIDFVEKYCTRAMWIDKGSIKAMGEADEIACLYKKSVPKLNTQKKIIDISSKQNQEDITKTSIKKSNMQLKDNTMKIKIEVDKSVETIKIPENQTRNNEKKVINVEHVGLAYSLFKKKLSNKGIKDIFKKSEKFWALQDINFSVRESEIIGIIGHNGAGKSTLCKVLTGILNPDKGKLFVDGDTSALLSLGAGFNEQLKAKDNIYLNGMMLGISKKQLNDAYGDIVRFSELESSMDKPVKHFSKGMRSRLAFSIAAMIKPDIFIIDEALSTGDQSFYEKASNKIKELIKNAKAVIVVTHNMSFVEKVCTRAILMEKGRIIFDGDPKEAVEIYRQSLRGKFK